MAMTVPGKATLASADRQCEAETQLRGLRKLGRKKIRLEKDTY